MKDRILKTVIVGSFCVLGWTVLSKFIGFESTVIIALATIYVNQKQFFIATNALCMGSLFTDLKKRTK